MKTGKHANFLLLMNEENGVNNSKLKLLLEKGQIHFLETYPNSLLDLQLLTVCMENCKYRKESSFCHKLKFSIPYIFAI